MVMSPMFLFSNRSYEYLKEPIKMHVEFSLLYKTLLIIEGQRHSKQKEAQYKF